MVPIFFINLDRSPDCREAMEQQFQSLGIAAERIAGIDRTGNLPASMVERFSRTRLAPGEVGCYASHLKAMQHLLDGPYHAAVILEDDVILDADFASVTEAAVAAAPQGWDIIHLSTNGKPRPMVKLAQTGDRWLVRYARIPINAAAYVVGRAGAAKMLKPRPWPRPIDIEFHYAWLAGLNELGLEPPPAHQRQDLPSTIDYPQWRAATFPKRSYWSPGPPSVAYGWFYMQRRLGLRGMLSCYGQTLARSLRKKMGGASAYMSPKPKTQ